MLMSVFVQNIVDMIVDYALWVAVLKKEFSNAKRIRRIRIRIRRIFTSSDLRNLTFTFVGHHHSYSALFTNLFPRMFIHFIWILQNFYAEF